METRVLSTRLSAEAVETLERESRRRGLTKREFLEQAIRDKAGEPAELEDDFLRVLHETAGALPSEASVEKKSR